MAGGLREKTRAMIHRPALGIGGPIDKPAEPGVAQRAGAHRARLQRHIKRAAKRQAIITEARASFPQRQHFRMSAGILKSDRPIMRLGEHPTVRPNEHCSDRCFARVGGGLRKRDRGAHVLDVLRGVSRLLLFVLIRRHGNRPFHASRLSKPSPPSKRG